MPQSEIRLWPNVPDLHALGARGFDDLIGASGALEGEDQGEFVVRSGNRSVLRYPLPGTVTRAGQRPARPRGAGTGFVYLTRWTGGSLCEKTSARLTTPRSQSFAARVWNLYCHLREHGVGTAQPLAMGQEPSSLFAARSFLATRELELMQPLPEYLELHRDELSRRRLARALGLMFARILDARVELPELQLSSVFVSRAPTGGACGSPVPGLALRNLPHLALASVRGGRIREQMSTPDAAKFLKGLWAQVESERQFGTRDFYRVFYHCLGRRLPRARRRETFERHFSGGPHR